MERQPGIETGVFMYKEGNFMIAITELFCFPTFEWLSKTYPNWELLSISNSALSVYSSNVLLELLQNHFISYCDVSVETNILHCMESNNVSILSCDQLRLSFPLYIFFLTFPNLSFYKRCLVNLSPILACLYKVSSFSCMR